MPAESRLMTPGTMASSPPAVTTMPAASASTVAGQPTYGASRQPWRLPIIPQASRGAGSSRQGPSSSASASAKPRSASFWIPRVAPRASSTLPSGPIRYARAADVPQSMPMSALADIW